jgi:hypothetical protein
VTLEDIVPVERRGVQRVNGRWILHRAGKRRRAGTQTLGDLELQLGSQQVGLWRGSILGPTGLGWGFLVGDRLQDFGGSVASIPFLLYGNVLLHLINVTETAHKLHEAGPITGVIIPAAGHEGVKDRWTEVRLGQPVSFLQDPNNILVFQPEERLLPEAQNLPHAHGEHPDITGCCETAEVDRLWGHPFDGETSHRGFVIVFIFNVPGKAKVPQLHTFRRGHQDVPDSDVPVHAVDTFQVGHGFAYLQRV